MKVQVTKVFCTIKEALTGKTRLMSLQVTKVLCKG